MYHSGTIECTKWGLNGDVSGRYYLVRPRHVVLFRPQNSVCLWGQRYLLNQYFLNLISQTRLSIRFFNQKFVIKQNIKSEFKKGNDRND